MQPNFDKHSSTASIVATNKTVIHQSMDFTQGLNKVRLSSILDWSQSLKIIFNAGLEPEIEDGISIKPIRTCNPPKSTDYSIHWNIITSLIHSSQHTGYTTQHFMPLLTQVIASSIASSFGIVCWLSSENSCIF